MRRVILDTNIYEFILREIDAETLQKIASQKEILVYGNEIIRKELRDIPKQKTGLLGKRLIRLRSALLGLYDLLIQDHIYNITSEMHSLAEKYYIAYRSAGGGISRNDIINDLLIVSFASIKKLDIVVSEDARSMLSDAAKHAYSVVNKIENLRLPNFIGLDSFINEIRRYAS